MVIEVMINMKNPNALIAMAQIAQNPHNPYDVICEYIKYCLYVNTSESMTIDEIREHVGKEFGLYVPHNVLLNCLKQLRYDGAVSYNQHQIIRTGEFNTEAFDNDRMTYRTTETAIIDSLINYVSKYDRMWDREYARELLIKTLDRNGLAFDIFMHKGEKVHASVLENIPVIDDMLPDEEVDVAEDKDVDNQPLFTDAFFVGKYIEEILAGTSIQKDYLLKICEGLMLCVGAYQLPSEGTRIASPQIKGSSFFFDTRLLLRFVGCAGDAAVKAAKELVTLIQNAGGSIFYYPQTLEEMNRAFDNAINSLSYGCAPRDDEMRLYSASIMNSIAVIAAKKANLKDELANHKIYLKLHEYFTEKERIRFGFDLTDLQQYMRAKLSWEPQVIDNDAFAIWETHMRRHGDYSDYCGSSNKLPIFVTTNSQLIGVSLKFREDRQHTSSICGWKQNRLPVITDMRLTCRLWSPAEQGERMSFLYLAANAVAAKRPTQRYLNRIRELAIQLGEQVPEYSGISLPSYFDDNITEAVLDSTMGDEEKLNIGDFASTIAELSEWKARDQEKITNQVISERDGVSDELKSQTQCIIDGAVKYNSKKLGDITLALRMILWWPAIATLLFAGIGSLLSLAIGNWNVVWITVLPMVFRGLEMFFSSMIVEKKVLKWYLPKAEKAVQNRIAENLRPAEIPYSDTIIEQVKEQLPLLCKCKALSKDE